MAAMVRTLMAFPTCGAASLFTRATTASATISSVRMAVPSKRPLPINPKPVDMRMHFLLLLPAALILSAQPASGQEKTGEERPAAQEKIGERIPAPAGQDNIRLWQSIGLDKTAHFASFRHPVKVAIIDDGFDLDN